MTDPREFHLAFPAEYGALTALQSAVEKFLREGNSPPHAAYILQLALEELVTNIVKYASAPDVPDAVEVHVLQSAGMLSVRLEYAGVAFDPVARPDPDFPASLQERSSGGMGLHLVKQLVEGFRYSRELGKNLLVFSVPLKD